MGLSSEGEGLGGGARLGRLAPPAQSRFGRF
jgi:hypothetical protein